MKKSVVFIVIIFAILSTGCDHAPEDKTDELTIYTTLYPIQYATERIAGDFGSVHSVYPPGVDAHTYEPTTKEMSAIAKSDAFIYLGAGMEGFADSAANALESTDVKNVEIGRHQQLFQKENTGSRQHVQDKDVDPHIWLDPVRMIEVASFIKDTLIELCPDEQKHFTANFNALKDDLIQLDNNFKEMLAGKTERTILVSHAAYGYWEERYDIDQLSIHGLSSSDEPSQRDLTKIIKQAREENMQYIIFEQNSSDRVAEIIQNHMDAKALTIHNLAVLTDDDIAKNEDYLSLMEHNASVLERVLDE